MPANFQVLSNPTPKNRVPGVPKVLRHLRKEVWRIQVLGKQTNRTHLTIFQQSFILVSLSLSPFIPYCDSVRLFML